MSIFLKTLAILVAVPECVCHCNFNLHFFYDYWCWSSFLCLLEIWMPSFVKCLLKSLSHFSMCFYLFVLLIYRDSLTIWGMSPLSIICVVSDFSYSVDLNMLLWKFSNIWWIICGKSIMNLYLSSSSFKNYYSMDNLVSLLPYPFLPTIGLF